MRLLDQAEIRQIVATGLRSLDLDGRRVLVIIPDRTRTMPMPAMVDLLDTLLTGRVMALDFLVALGTHPLMTDAELTAHLGRPVIDGDAGGHRVFNHRWDLPETIVSLGTISAAEIRELTDGRLDRDVSVALNRLILDYDHILICGPVFPHEVVGFSGGNKYLFPGIAGREIIDFTHWLGALISSYAVIGNPRTPVRAVIDRAARMVPKPVSCISLVVTSGGIAGIYVGSPEASWSAAAALSARVHIIEVERPLRRVLAVMPEIYQDLWTAAKGMYKVEPAIADGGEVVIFAPHITEVSYTHGAAIDEIGYHCRDYFLAQWSRYESCSGGVLAHSTHLKGLGTYDPATGVESPRIHVTLATGIAAERCARLNLGYLDPVDVRPAEWIGREHEGVMIVPRAGEMLYRLKGART